MISYDAEIHVSRQKEMARRAAESYPHIRHLENGNYPAYRRALAGLGVRLVALGLRMQGEIAQLPAPELAGLGLTPGDPCLEC